MSRFVIIILFFLSSLIAEGQSGNPQKVKIIRQTTPTKVQAVKAVSLGDTTKRKS